MTLADFIFGCEREVCQASVKMSEPPKGGHNLFLDKLRKPRFAPIVKWVGRCDAVSAAGGNHLFVLFLLLALTIHPVDNYN